MKNVVRFFKRGAGALSATVATTLLCVSAFARDPIASRGVYIDSAGERHEWVVTGGHTLLWDGKPFVPVGGLFQVQSWGANTSDADFAADTAALETLKKSGVRDVYLQAPRGGLTRVSPQAIQRVFDLLDREGFTYGLSLNDGPSEVLTGYDVRPGKYRDAAPENGALLRFPVERVASALFFVVGETGGAVITSGEAAVVAEGVRVQVPPVPGRNVVFVLPQIVHFSSATIGFPNVWEGFDGYRDRLISLFRQIKPGKGFRFFLDPLPADLAYPEDAESFVPTGAAFQIEWGEWLSRRYKTVENLQRSWNITDGGVQTFENAAVLIPLWGGGKGVEQLYDRAANRTLRVGTASSSYWRDLDAFKVASLRGYMNDLATALKKAAANVPVVYRSHGYSPLFAELPAKRGFDGIGIDAYGRGTDLVTRSAAYVYAQASEAPKTMWTPVTATSDAKAGEKTAPGYGTRTALHSDLDWLRELGARGFFVDGVRIIDPTRKKLDLSGLPDQLHWLADYGDVLTTTGVRSEASANAATPDLVFFPRGMDAASIRPLRGGGWWLPTDRAGAVYNFGVCGRVYGLRENDGSITYYLWNPLGTREVKLKVPKSVTAPGAPVLKWSSSAGGTERKGILTLMVGTEPVRLFNYPTIPIPLDAFDEAIKEAKPLLAALRKQSGPEGGRYEIAIAEIKQHFNDDNPVTSYAELQQLLNELRDLMRPYSWIEAESAAQHSFDMRANRAGASGANGGQVLKVAARAAGARDATALYGVRVKAAGAYNVWVAATPDSLLTFRLDGRPLLDEAIVARPTGAPYSDTGGNDGGLIWMRLGVANLTVGTHALEMRASGAATVDTILLTRDDFMPSGPNPPPVRPDPVPVQPIRPSLSRP